MQVKSPEKQDKFWKINLSQQCDHTEVSNGTGSGVRIEQEPSTKMWTPNRI